MISNFNNRIEDFQSNDIVLPAFNPKVGSTDFSDDKHLQWLYNYLNFLESLEIQAVDDVRRQI